MIEIRERRSSIWITPYTRYSISTIEKTLSVYDFQTRKYTQFLYEFDPLEEDRPSVGVLKLPRGIGVDFVNRCFEDAGTLNYKIVDQQSIYPDPRKVEIEMRSAFVNPRDEFQEKAISFLMNEKDPQKFLSLDTGFGKTFCTINYLSKVGLPTLIISKNLSEQWLEFVTDYTKCQNERDVEILQGSKILEDYSKPHGFKKKHKASFYITTIDTLRSFASRAGPLALQNLADELEIGIKVFDEAHSNYILNNKIDLNMQVKETIYLTATPARSNQNEDRVFKKIFALVPTHGVYTHLVKQYYYINKITFNSNPTERDINRCSTSRGFNSKNYSEYMFSSNIKKYFVYGLIRGLLIKLFKNDPDSKCLVLLDLLKDIQWFHDMIEQDPAIIALNKTCGMYCTIIKDKEAKEKELDNPIILGTLGSLSAGHDIPGLRVIIPFTSFSSGVIARQLLGRLRYIEGKAVYYFDIIDEGFPSMIHQRKERMKIFEPRAKEITNKFISVDEVLDSLEIIKKPE
jgi:superfamily II DNA or RNA helicase